MKFVNIFMYLIFFIPIIGVLLYTIMNPRDAALWGKRWQFKNEDLEPSDEAIKYNRIISIAVLIFVVFILVLEIVRS